MKKALFFRTNKKTVECGLCMHWCVIKPGRRGICGVRENRDGVLHSLVYGKLSAEQIDPVEKKPLFHFLPGTLTYSIATIGCNFRCLHCQNYTISQAGNAEHRVPYVIKNPEDIVNIALGQGCGSISYTYVEPTVFFEFAYDCSVAAKKNNLKNIFVSNGYMSTEAAQMLVPVLDGINVDIKSFSEDFYHDICGAGLKQVLSNVRYFREQGVWVEVTTLLIPGLNDSDEEIKAIAEFIVDVDPDIAWHISAFRPTYRMVDRPSTNPERLQQARIIGLETGVKHVYVGNIRGGEGGNTICPACHRTIIERTGFNIVKNGLSSGACPYCAAEIAGVWY